jgi:hypothetical protein
MHYYCCYYDDVTSQHSDYNHIVRFELKNLYAAAATSFFFIHSYCNNALSVLASSFLILAAVLFDSNQKTCLTIH